MRMLLNRFRKAILLAFIALISITGQGDDWSLLAVQKRLGLMQCINLTNTVTITDGTNSITFKPGYRRASFNDTTIWLNDAAIPDYKKTLTISAADVLRFLEPIVKGIPSAVTSETFRVFIDPGHGGDDGGAVSKINGQLEKDLVLDVSNRLGAYLEAAGASVHYSRTNDVFLTLARRPQLAAATNANIFVSIHANIAGAANARGSETFALTLAGYDSTSTGSGMRTKERAGNAFDHDNAILGYLIHKNLPGPNGEKDRGLRRARFQVLRDAPCPAVLIELGFLSHDAETYSLASPRFRERLAMAISKGIVEYMQRAIRKDGEQ